MQDIPVAERQVLVGEVADLLHTVGRRVRTAIRSELDPLGLTPGRARALRAIVDADHDGVRSRMGDLAGALRVAPRSATEVVDLLVREGLVERVADPRDRRAVVLRPTASGRAAAQRVAGARHRAVEDLAAGLGTAELDVLRDLLGRLDRRGVPAAGELSQTLPEPLGCPRPPATDHG